MLRLPVTILSIWVLATIMPLLLRAKELSIDLNPAKTKIVFVLSATFHIVHGTFDITEGHLLFDPSTGAMKGDIVVNAASGNSGNGMRDRRMTREVLQAQRFPQIRFAPDAYSGTITANGASNIDVHGVLMIHGQAHKITLPMQVRMSHDEVTAKGKLVVPYVKWGMKNPSRLFLKVSKNVELDITAVGRIAPASVP
ncbi:MAG: YceI family protein [Terriglobia bacterium]